MDGTTKYVLNEARFIINVKKDHHIRFRMDVRRCSNTQEKFLALWGLLWFTGETTIFRINNFGDSRVAINWETSQFEMHTIHL